MTLLETIRNNAKNYNKRIVLPEGTEERTLKAANIILEENIAKIILLGNSEEINNLAAKWKLKNIIKATIIDPVNHDKKDFYANLLFEIRKGKGVTKEDALKLVENPLYLATLLIKNRDADGEVAGADNSTGNVLRPAFQIIKTLPGISVVSGAFFMILDNKDFGDDGVIVFADCAVHPDPNENELAQIAICTANTAKSIGDRKSVV